MSCVSFLSRSMRGARRPRERSAELACIFCGSEENLTREHVFPAFMGGKLEVPDGSCKQCNGAFGKCEAELRVNTTFLLNMFGIKNRDGAIPEAKVAIGIRGIDVEGLSGHRIGGGEIKLSDKVVDVIDADGKPRRRGIFTKNVSADKFISKSKARGEQVTRAAGSRVPDARCILQVQSAVLPRFRNAESRREDRSRLHRLRAGYLRRVFSRLRPAAQRAQGKQRSGITRSGVFLQWGFHGRVCSDGAATQCNVLSQRRTEKRLGIGYAIWSSYVPRRGNGKLHRTREQEFQHFLRCGTAKAILSSGVSR